MCGIAGIIDFAGESVPASTLRAACDGMRHRGPDDRGTFIDEHEALSVGMAAVRLAVVDPTPAGRQPFIYADGRYALAYNGEIYNHRALRHELREAGCSFTSETDTEVVAAACARWGMDALRRFNGMYALVFFDRVERSGFLARDRFGIKPLLIARQGNRLCFASEMTTLRMLGDWDRAVDNDALMHYLHFGYFAAPQTIYSASSRVEPGCCISFDTNGAGQSTCYVQPPNPETCNDYTEGCARVHDALFESVARRRVADVPLGAFLSGGLDSAIIATHLAQCTPGPIKTFSIGYAEHATYDETPYARMMASHLGSEHHELRLTFGDVLDALTPLLDHQGEPFFDSSILPTAIVSEHARQHVTVCLSGDGGDELFGGYWRYLGHESLAAYERLPRWLRSGMLEPLLAGSPVSKSSVVANRARQIRKLLRGGRGSCAMRHLRWSKILAPEASSILLDADTGDKMEAAVLDRMQAMANQNGSDAMNAILAFDTRYSLPSDMLHKVDLASMYHSLEVRVPFLDPDVVAIAESCPSSFKVDRGLRKRMLVDAYRGLIPDAVLDRPKMGFEVPVGEFLRTEWRELFLSTVTRERIESFGVLDWSGVTQVYDAHCERRAEHADLLFALLSLCWWRMRGG